MTMPLRADQLPARPITVLIAALGGEGGGVLSNWLVDAATAQGLPVQSTSIPGVAQRTGATTYYLEIYPVRLDALSGRRPVLALTPSPGNVDVMVASELLEAGRAMQNGYVSPDRTALIASTHRIYAIAERSAMADGRYDAERLQRAARSLAKRRVLFDMSAAAAQAGTVISAVMFGAIAGATVLPLSREACEQVIRRSGKGAESSLRGFAIGFAAAAGHVPAATPERGRAAPAPVERVRGRFPAETHHILEEAVARLIDYQDRAYANLLLDRLEPLVSAERAAGGDAHGYPLTNETGRHLALWMSYEDVIRVADLKTRRARFERVRAEVGAKPHEPVRIVEFLKPGVEELCAVLPPSLARPVLAWAKARGKSFNAGMHVPTTSVWGFLLMRTMAWLKPWRRRTSRFQDEQRLIERWLAAIRAAAAVDAQLALEIAECARLIKGYGDTHARGTGNFLRLFETLVEGSPELGPAERATRLRQAREAALADPEGKALGQALVGGSATPEPVAKPVVWLTPKRTETLSTDAD
ncbi:MAG TPA: indolepyruvate oxidoreductase subunit beta family protein [Burkholderiales bacterium]|nr:indolepyruvate oxidoreductase subunit beta family protein [Burkholderiales bacterium]